MNLPEAINQLREERLKLIHTPNPNLTLAMLDAIDIVLKEFDKEEGQIILTQEEQNFIETLAKVENYPLNRKRDLELYKTLSERYPTVDIIEAVKDWAIHKLGDPLKPKSNPRSQINTWAQNCSKWNKNLKKDKSKEKSRKYNDIYL